MPVVHAIVHLPTPLRYIGRLCNHFTHRVTVHREVDGARIQFAGGLCSLQATEQKLEIRIEATDAASLDRLQQVVARHLKQVASAETFDVQWVRSDR